MKPEVPQEGPQRLQVDHQHHAGLLRIRSGVAAEDPYRHDH
jgi:hypothetical protein